ncbi:Fe(3+)-siderophore ABC transporter permease [Kocuria coralli]|uniref:Fe(3+)-siderophore ABC transporter permease n=2 Tax=Kocuria coralli TaxID=1461025 RepID=A0A5J5L1J0_9MICC|nr:Fe(3+)-siderophore ABC transporter permease [Kocuria coralli]
MVNTMSPPASEKEAAAATEPAGVPRRLAGLLVALACLALVIVLSLMLGARDVPPGTVWRALTGTATGMDADAVVDLRLPRTVLGLCVGMGLGVAGALIQAVTRNPLADPGILGVNYGSAFAVALGVGVLGVTAPAGYVWFAFGGALVTTVVVYLIGSVGRGSASPVRITLAGVAIGAVLSGITTALVLADPVAFNRMRAWEAGSFADRGWEPVIAAAPFVVIGLVLAVYLGSSLNAVALGDDLARSLGAKVIRTRILSLIAITLLAGAASAMAGPIAFVGLMIPHVARWIVGPDQRWIILYSILFAPILTVAADVLGRLVLPTGEMQVGIVTAFLGAPVLIVLVRRHRVSAL